MTIASSAIASLVMPRATAVTFSGVHCISNIAWRLESKRAHRKHELGHRCSSMSVKGSLSGQQKRVKDVSEMIWTPDKIVDR